MRLAFMFFLGIVLMMTGFEANLGSILGSLIAPADMVEN